MTFLERAKRFSPAPPHYLFAFVVLVRLIVLVRLTASPLLMPSRGDMHFYNDWAMRILHGQWAEPHAFYGLPGYPYLLALIYRLTVPSPFIPALVQALLEGGTAFLLYHIAVRAFPSAIGKSIGLAAGIAWAFFVPAQAYAAILMPTSWLVFVFWLLTYAAMRTDYKVTFVTAAAAGTLVGVTATLVATTLFILPLLLISIWLRVAAATRRWAMIVTLFLGVAAGTSPCWIHNYFVARDPVMLSAHSGINFWIGNNPAANGYPRFPPGLHAGQAAMLQDSIDVAEANAGRPLKRADVSRYWSAQAKAFIAAHPAAWAGLVARKLRNFWNAFQYDDLSVITILREERVLLPGLYFGLVAALGLPGLVLAWKNAPRARWFIAAILLHMCALLPVFTTERYRLAAVPGLLLCASYFVVSWWRDLARADLRGTFVNTVLVVASTMFVGWPQHDASLWALDAYNSGWQALECNNVAVAEKKLLLARSYVPTNPETNFALGNLRLVQGDDAAATQYYRLALTYDPQHRGALNNLAVLALRNQRLSEAETWLKRALDVDGRNAKTHFLVARLLLAQGDSDAARIEADRAIALQPAQPEFRAFRQGIAVTP